MKTVVGICLLALMVSCGPDPAPVFKYTYTVINSAGFEVRLSCQGCETVILKTDEERILKTNTLFPDYLVEPTAATIRKIDFEETDGDEWTIRSYEFDVIYLVGGTANAIDVTLKNASGQTEQYMDVEPPLEYYFQDFASDDLYLSATNKGVSGTVQVFIYHKEKLVVGDTNVNSWGTATATGSIGD